jgi:type IV pilus assembly protein PilQ
MFQRRSLFFIGAFTFFLAAHAFSQDDLIKEIDALNDFPEADVSQNQTQAPPATGGELDALPVDDTPLDEAPILGSENALQGPPTALSAVADSSAANMTDMNFKQLGDRVRLVLNATRAPDFKREVRKQRKQFVLELSNTRLSKTFLKRALDTGDFDGPVALVQAFDAKDAGGENVKILFQLRDLIEPTISRSGNALFVDFPMVFRDGVIFKGRVASGPKPELFLTINDSVNFTGSRISLNVKDAPLADVLNFLSKASGQNFVLAEGNNAKVTVNVKNTPWDQVLAVILVNAELGYQKVGNTYRIARIVTLRSEIEEAAKSRENEKKLEPLETRLFTLSYLNAKDARTSIEKFLKDQTRENATIDERTNSLVVTGISENVERISRFLSSVDRQTPQVQIDSRIVETTDELNRQLQFGWGLTGVNANRVKVDRLSQGGRNTGGNFIDNARFQVGRSLGTLDAFLNASETDTKTKVIAAPRVVVSNNQIANLFQGSEELVLVADREGAQQTKTYDYTLDLKVTPQVTNDGFVLLDINLKRDTPSTVLNSEQAKDRRGISTKMLVKSGETAVIGGLYIDDDTATKTGVPWLRDIPVLGALFNNNWSKIKERKELLMFISPKILNEEAALVRASASNVPQAEL